MTFATLAWGTWWLAVVLWELAPEIAPRLEVPLGVACSLVFFGESADLTRLAASLLLLTAAVAIAEYAPTLRGRGKF